MTSKRSADSFSTSWTLRCSVEFTHTEQTVIREANLGDRPIYRQDQEEVTLRQFIGRGCRLSWDFSSTLAHRHNRAYLEDQMLP